MTECTDEEILEIAKRREEERRNQDLNQDFKKIFEEYKKQNKKLTLWEVMREQLGFSIDMCDEIINAVEKWLPPEHDSNDYQWNKCIKMMKENLR